MTTHPVSPNTVLANALTHAEDVLAPAYGPCARRG